ncbi:MAG: hypothetical protein QG567_720 [Campylobacterota bacterium]|nr:hypothetical protein [Campylobacterota bacterium]
MRDYGKRADSLLWKGVRLEALKKHQTEFVFCSCASLLDYLLISCGHQSHQLRNSPINQNWS